MSRKFRKLPVRFYIGINLFLCTSVTYMYRTCFNLILRDMVQTTQPPPICSNSKHHHYVVARYNWSSDEQIYIVSAFYIGYVITNLLGGVLSERFGATKTISYILFISAGSFSVIPLIVGTYGYWTLFILRLGQGVIEGPIYPCINHLIAHWAPPSERARFISVFAGSSFGSMIGHAIASLTVRYLAWPFAFYLTAVIGGLVCLNWMFYATDRPDMHTRAVLDQEHLYIEAAIGPLVSKDKKSIPYLRILGSGPVWALIMLNLGASFASYFSMNALPSFYTDILSFSVDQVGDILAISSLIRLATGLSFSYLGDLLLARDLMGVTTQRKFFSLFSHIIPGVIFTCMCFTMDHPLFSAGLDVVMTAIMGSLNLTVNQNSQDLSPNFSSTIYGVINFTGSIGGFSSLLFLSFFLNSNDSFTLPWAYMFYICAGFLFVGGLIFLLFGTGKTQSWNEPVLEDKPTEKMRSSADHEF